jgi:hypothetical protein
VLQELMYLIITSADILHWYEHVNVHILHWGPGFSYFSEVSSGK